MVIIKEITLQDYIKCSISSGNQWSSSKPGQYGKGLGNDTKDPQKIERVSKIAEVVVAGVFDTAPPDFEYKRGGDGGWDLEIAGLKVDIKCALRNYGAGVFKGLTKGGKSTVKSDIYIFCYLEDEDRVKQTATVVIVGYLTKDEILELELVPPRKRFTSRPINYDVKHSKMHPIEQLAEDLGIQCN